MIDSAPNPLMNWEIINKYGFVVNAPANKDKIPTTVTVSEIKKACLLPLVSEIKFITIRPVKEPTGKHAWMMTRAHYKSQ